MSDLATQRVLNERYQLTRLIGSGGFGEVYSAYDLQEEREVAVKLMSSDLSKRDEYVERFVREAQLTSTLRHPHTLTIYDFGQDGESLFLVSELLRGESLKSRLKHAGALSPGLVIHWLTPICEALTEAHSLGIIHRDLKPDNLFVHSGSGPERLILLDFGIAKSLDDLHRTRTGQLFGTPHYMSPEQIKSARQVDARSDLYSLGIILFEALTGELPYQADSLFEIFEQHVRAPIPSLVGYHIKDLELFDLLIQSLLQKDPDQRLKSADEVTEVLRGLSEAYPFTELPVSGSIDHSPTLTSPQASLVIATPHLPSEAETLALDEDETLAETLAETPKETPKKTSVGYPIEETLDLDRRGELERTLHIDETSDEDPDDIISPTVTAHTFSLGHISYSLHRYGATLALLLFTLWGLKSGTFEDLFQSEPIVSPHEKITSDKKQNASSGGEGQAKPSVLEGILNSLFQGFAGELSGPKGVTIETEGETEGETDGEDLNGERREEPTATGEVTVTGADVTGVNTGAGIGAGKEEDGRGAMKRVLTKSEPSSTSPQKRPKRRKHSKRSKRSPRTPHGPSSTSGKVEGQPRDPGKRKPPRRGPRGSRPSTSVRFGSRLNQAGHGGPRSDTNSGEGHAVRGEELETQGESPMPPSTNMGGMARPTRELKCRFNASSLHVNRDAQLMCSLYLVFPNAERPALSDHLKVTLSLGGEKTLIKGVQLTQTRRAVLRAHWSRAGRASIAVCLHNTCTNLMVNIKP